VVDFGKLLKRGKKLVDEHGDKVASGVDKATDLVDKKTKGKYRDQLEKVDEAAQKLDRQAAEPTDRRARGKSGETG
jgi:hypothetical protein